MNEEKIEDRVITKEKSPKSQEEKRVKIWGEILVLKGVFKVLPEEKAKGTFLILAYGETGEILYTDITTTQDAQARLPATTISWQEFEVALSHFKKRYLFDAQTTLPLRNSLLSLGPDLIKDLYQKALQLKEEEIYSIIKDEMKKGLPVDKDIDLKLNSEIILRQDYQKVVEQKAEIKEKEETEEEKTVYLKVQVAIDPVKGKLVSELNKGEKLLVKIVDDSNLAQYLSSLLGGRNGEELIPLPAYAMWAEEKEMERFRLVVKFGPGVYGESIISDKVKIKVVEEKDLEEIVSLPSSKNREWTIKLSPLILGELILLILFIALIILGKIIP